MFTIVLTIIQWVGLAITITLCTCVVPSMNVDVKTTPDDNPNMITVDRDEMAFLEYENERLYRKKIELQKKIENYVI